MHLQPLFRRIGNFLPVRFQFLFSYAIMGSLMPYLTIYLNKELGISESTIGLLLAGAAVSVVLSPVVMTAIADTKISGRQLLGIIFLCNTACMLAMAYFAAPWAAFVFFGVHVFLFVSVLPLLDGMNFTVQKLRMEAGKTTTPYHQIRIWGTVGFIIPSLLIYVLLESGFSVGIILYSTAGFALLSFLNTRRLPTFKPGAQEEETQQGKGEKKRKLPTMDAAAVLFRGRTLAFCVAMFLAHGATTAYMAFYPIYLTRTIGFSDQVAGLVFNIGAFLEIFFLLGLGWAMRKFGLKWILIIGMASTTLRMLTLAAFPTPEAAILTQILHGPIIIAIHVGPVLYLNSIAGDRFRNSIQGLFTMVIVGAPRIIASLWAGSMAERYPDLLMIYFISGVICIFVVVLLAIFFKAENDKNLT